jgi:hypothetical protein
MIEATIQLNEFPATLSVTGTDSLYSASGVTGNEQRTSVNQLQTYILAPIAQSTLADASPLTGLESIPLGRSGLLQISMYELVNYILTENPEVFAQAAIAWLNSLSTQEPASPGVWWNNGGTIAQS